MKAVDKENLRDLLVWLRATMLNTGPPDKIEIPHSAAAEIVAVLSSLPLGKAGRPKLWSLDTEIRAIFSLLDGKSVKALAREIAKETRQPEPSARRRLQELKKSRHFENWRR